MVLQPTTYFAGYIRFHTYWILHVGTLTPHHIIFLVLYTVTKKWKKSDSSKILSIYYMNSDSCQAVWWRKILSNCCCCGNFTFSPILERSVYGAAVYSMTEYLLDSPRVATFMETNGWKVPKFSDTFWVLKWSRYSKGV